MQSVTKTFYVYRMVLFFSIMGMVACGDDDDSEEPDDGSGGTGTELFSLVLGGSGDDTLLAIDQTDDGGYIAAGYSESGGGNTTLTGEGAWVVKLSRLGEIEWSRGYTPMNSESGFFNDVKQASDGNYILCGRASNPDNDQGWIMKLDDTGDILWETTLPGQGDAELYAVTETSGDLVVAVGYLTIPGSNVGEQAWLQSVSLTSGVSRGSEVVGGFGDDAFQGLAVDAFNQFVVAVGYTSSPSVDTDDYQGADDVLLAKINPVGGLVSLQAMGGTGDESAFDVALTSDGSFIIGAITDSQDGAVGSFTGDDAIWLFNVEDGTLDNMLWSETEPANIDLEEGRNDLELSPNGDIQIACSECMTAINAQDAILYRMNSLGQSASLLSYGGSEGDIAYQSRSISTSRTVILAVTESSDGDVPENTFGGTDAWIFVVNQ